MLIIVINNSLTFGLDNNVTKKVDFRATWVCTISNIDFKKGTIKEQKEQIESIVENAHKMNMNAIFFQVSPEADAFYKSQIVPWSRYVNGKFGEDPGFDPLQYFIDIAHRKDIELHAWFNPYRVTLKINNEIIQSLNIKKSVFFEHPDWIVKANDRYLVNPGIPDARKWVENRVIEVVKNYNIDGIHFDDYFYYGSFDDKETFKKYSLGIKSIEDWRRNNTYLLIKETKDEIKKIKPNVTFGVSPSAVWANDFNFKEGSKTTTSYTNYFSCFADTKKWVEDKIIDYIVPQVYFSITNNIIPYKEIVLWWSNLCKSNNVKLYIGQGFYLINDSKDASLNGSDAVYEMRNQFKFNQDNDIDGSVIFRYSNIIDDDKSDVINMIKNEFWNRKSLCPAICIGDDLEEVSRCKILNNKLYWNDYGVKNKGYLIYSNNNLIDIVFRNGRNNFEYKINENEFENILIKTISKENNESMGVKPSNSLYFDDVFSNAKSIDFMYLTGIETNNNFNSSQIVKKVKLYNVLFNLFDIKSDIKKIQNTKLYSSNILNTIGVEKESKIDLDIEISKSNIEYSIQKMFEYKKIKFSKEDKTKIFGEIESNKYFIDNLDFSKIILNLYEYLGKGLKQKKLSN